MYRRNWGRALLSRGVAVALLYLPIAWLSQIVSEAEAAITAEMSRQELIEYIGAGATIPYANTYLFLLVAAVVFVALAEAIAAGLRAVWPAARTPIASDLLPS